MKNAVGDFVRCITPKRRWAQFSLRTLFAVMTVLCVWLAVQVNRANRQHQAVANIRRLGGRVQYDFEFVRGESDWHATSPLPEWATGALGVDFFHNGVEVVLIPAWDAPKDEAPLRWLAGFPRLKRLVVGAQATDEGLAHVGRLKHLEEIHILKRAEQPQGNARCRHR